MSQPARLALVGTGWAGRVHALAAASTGTSVVAIVDRTTVAATSLADAVDLPAYGVDDLHGDIGADRIDAAVIATPPATHAPLAGRLLTAGTAVLIETPLAATLAEADAIVEEATASSAVACYAENLAVAPAVDLASARRAELGALDHLEVRMSQPRPASDDPDRLAAGGVALELGVRAIALAVLLAHDEPVAVRARLEAAPETGIDETEIDEVGRIELRFASDLIAAIDVSWRADTIEWSAQAASAQGVVRLELQPELVVEVDGEPVALPAPPPGRAGHASDIDPRIVDLGFHAQLDAFASVVAGRGGRVCPVGFGRSMLEVVCAAYLSAGRDGDEVLLADDVPRHLTPRQLWHGMR